MSTRTRRTTSTKEDAYFDYEFGDRMDLDALSDDELEQFLFENEEETSKGVVNLPTMAGLSMIVVGMAYIFQKLGVLTGLPSMETLIQMLPWLAGVLIILLGFGVLSWRPNRKKKKKAKAKAKPAASSTKATPEKSSGTEAKKRLRKSRDKKLAGVCGGIADYLNLDPTLVRIAFVIGTIISQGIFIPAYIVLAMIMAKAEPLSVEERITIIRDS